MPTIAGRHAHAATTPARPGKNFVNLPNCPARGPAARAQFGQRGLLSAALIMHIGQPEAERQAGLADEAAQEHPLMANRLGVLLHPRFQILQLLEAVIGQMVVLGVVPQPLHRVQLRGVRRKELQLDPAALGDPLPHLPPAMDIQVVPDDDDGATQMTRQITEEADHLPLTDVATGMGRQIQPQPSSAR